MSRTHRATAVGGLGLLLLGLGGCVGLVRTRLDWAPAASPLGTRSEVLTRLGEPLSRAQEDGREVWTYDLPAGSPARAAVGDQAPAAEGWTVLYALITPVWWPTRPEQNVRIVLRGETVAAVETLRRGGDAGFFCGLNWAARYLFLCGPVP